MHVVWEVDWGVPFGQHLSYYSTDFVHDSKMKIYTNHSKMLISGWLSNLFWECGIPLSIRSKGGRNNWCLLICSIRPSVYLCVCRRSHHYHYHCHYQVKEIYLCRVVSPKIPVSIDADWPWKPPDIVSGASYLGLKHLKLSSDIPSNNYQP